MAAKFIIFLAIVGATYALAASPKFRRDAEASGEASDESSSSDSSEKSSSSSSGSSSSSSSSSSSNSSSGSSSSLSIQEQVSTILAGNDHTTILDLSGLGWLKSRLSEKDFTNITFVAKVPTLKSLKLLPPILDLKESLRHARSRLVIVLNGTLDVQTTIQEATIKALHAPSPVQALSDMCYTILNTYYTLAVNSPSYIATAFILEEGVQLVTASLKVVAQVVVEVEV